jgi:hypothetical protein
MTGVRASILPEVVCIGNTTKRSTDILCMCYEHVCGSSQAGGYVSERSKQTKLKEDFTTQRHAVRRKQLAESIAPFNIASGTSACICPHRNR